jgi:hypothetical protein
MSWINTEVDLGFTKLTSPGGLHICLIYNNEAERREIVENFVQSGLNSFEKVAYFADQLKPLDVNEWLKSYNITVNKNLKPGQFHLATALETYTPDGKFEPEQMLSKLEAIYHRAKDEDFHGCRGSGEMTWALNEIPGSNRLLEYESRINNLLVENPLVVMCQYDARRFNGATILGVLKVHPFMIVKGMVVQNPYYETPDEYLENLQ